MLSICILSIICIGYIFDFKRTFIVVVVLSTWLMHFTLFPNASLFQIISVLTVLFFLIRKGFSGFGKFYFAVPILFISISYLITTFFSEGKQHIFYVTSSICTFLFLYIFYSAVRGNKNNQELFAFCTLAYGCFIGIYAIIETFYQFNPLVEYFVSNNLYRQDFIIESMRFGFKRSQSIFSMHTTSGAVCITIAATLAYLKYYTNLFKGNRIVMPLILLLSIDVFLTGARSAIIGYVIVLLSFLPLLKRNFTKQLVFFMFLFLISGSYLITIIDSIQDTESVSGSNIDMRTIQFGIGQYFLQISPLFGNGLLFTYEVALTKFPDLLGAESVWLPVMIDLGFLGIICHILIVIYGLTYCFKNRLPWFSMYIMGFLVFFTLSSIPCFEFIFPLLSIIYMVEVRNQFKKNVIQNNTNYE